MTLEFPRWRVVAQCRKVSPLDVNGRASDRAGRTGICRGTDAVRDPTLFRPQIAIFTRDRPAWVLIPPELKTYETLPG
jgi:hypothetical protein